MKQNNLNKKDSEKQIQKSSMQFKLGVFLFMASSMIVIFGETVIVMPLVISSSIIIVLSVIDIRYWNLREHILKKKRK